MIRTFFNSLRQARIDAELQEIITEGNRTRESADQIREFLLKVLQEDIAVQMTVLAQCALRGVPTNVEAELSKDASAEEIIRCVVRV